MSERRYLRCWCLSPEEGWMALPPNQWKPGHFLNVSPIDEKILRVLFGKQTPRQELVVCPQHAMDVIVYLPCPICDHKNNSRYHLGSHAVQEPFEGAVAFQYEVVSPDSPTGRETRVAYFGPEVPEDFRPLVQWAVSGISGVSLRKSVRDKR